MLKFLALTLLILGGILLLYYYFIERPRRIILDVKKWLSAKGVFIHIHSGGFIKENGKNFFRAEYWLYEYSVNGKRYENAVIDTLPRVGRYSEADQPLEDAADEEVQHYKKSAKVGDEVTVYYNPLNFSQSCLVRHAALPRRYKTIFIFAVIAFLLPIILFN